MKIPTDIIIPGVIVITVLVGMVEKKNIYEIFVEGAKDGMYTAFKLFPTFIGIFLAITMLRASGILNFFSNILSFLKMFNIPSEIIPLSLIRPVSGSGAIAMGTEIMKQFGVDSRIGLIAAAVMGSSETTFYVISIYTSTIKTKSSTRVLISAVLADIASIVTAIIILKQH